MQEMQMVVMLHKKMKQKNITEQVGQGVELLQMQDILVQVEELKMQEM